MEDALSILPAKKVAAAGPALSTTETPHPAPVAAATASCWPLQSISQNVQQPAPTQTVPPPALPPPVDARSYQQRKRALFQNIDTLPSVINLGKYNSDGKEVEGFSEMSEAEQMLLVQRLKADPCHVTSLKLAANCTRRTVQLQMADATESMTALQSLDLSSNAACFVMLFLGRVLSMVEGVETRGVWVWCVLRC